MNEKQKLEKTREISNRSQEDVEVVEEDYQTKKVGQNSRSDEELDEEELLPGDSEIAYGLDIVMSIDNKRDFVEENVKDELENLLINSDERSARKSSAQTLSESGIIQPVAELARQGDAGERKEAVHSLEYDDTGESTPYLITAMRTDPEEEVRSLAVFSLDVNEDTIPYFKEAASSDDSKDVRRRALSSIYDYDKEEAFPFMKKVLEKDDSEYLKKKIFRSFWGNYADPEFEDYKKSWALAKLGLEGDHSTEVKETALEYLDRIDLLEKDPKMFEKDVLPVLEEVYTSDKDSEEHSLRSKIDDVLRFSEWERMENKESLKKAYNTFKEIGDDEVKYWFVDQIEEELEKRAAWEGSYEGPDLKLLEEYEQR